MTATLDGVPKKAKPEPSPEQRAAEELVSRAGKQGLSLTGPDGLLRQLTKAVLETALSQELTEETGGVRGRPVSVVGSVRAAARLARYERR
jgi:putative transposase